MTLTSDKLLRLAFPRRNEREHLVLDDGFLFVDPGLEGTGYAYYNRLVMAPDPEDNRPWPAWPSHWDTLRERGGSWLSRARRLAQAFGGVLACYGDPWVIVEWPGLWPGSAKSFASAGSGNLFKLAALAGMIAGQSGRLPVIVEPGQWRGQLPNRVVKERVVAAFGQELERASEHAVDAVGMGLAAQGGLGQ